ncbi:MAG: hypothetical protein Q9227_009229 [Pyrenula ochraceoflavens]
MSQLTRPYLLYVYPWMPYPRRVTIYLRERAIPPSLVTVVPVSDPQKGDSAPSGYPPRPTGSLPILAIPSTTGPSYTYLDQSVAIMSYLEGLCETQAVQGLTKPARLMSGGDDVLSRAKNLGYMHLADQALACWNPVRLFGSGAGLATPIPAAAKEALVWEKRELKALDKYLQQDADFPRRLKSAAAGIGPVFGDIMLYSFLELADEMYGIDLTEGSGRTSNDAYGRVGSVETYPALNEFYDLFKARPSVVRRSAESEEIPPEIRKRGRMWAKEVFV